jgi:hypothetical protein
MGYSIGYSAGFH